MGFFKPKLNKDIESKMKTLNAKAFIAVPHVNGLPISENALCQLYYSDDKIVIDGSGTTFNLSFDKIQAIEMKTDIEIQKQYVSSVGSGIAGAMVFGPLGALIGGRVKEKKFKDVKRYLIITYQSDEEIKYLGFDITYTPKGIEFVKLFNQNEKKENIINL